VTVLLREILEPPVNLGTEVEQRLADAVDLYDNDDTVARRVALTADARGDAAFWTKARYHSQRACQLQIAANQMPLRNALRATYKLGSDWVAALETLLPLNGKAAAALAAEYAEYGLWRDEPELLARASHRARTTAP